MAWAKVERLKDQIHQSCNLLRNGRPEEALSILEAALRLEGAPSAVPPPALERASY
jgi:hypothetical protein